MSQIQFLRVILLLNNVTAATLSFISTWPEYALYMASGMVLLLSWLVNLAVIGHTLLLMRPSKGHERTHNGYISLQATEYMSSGSSSSDSNSKHKPSFRITVLTTLLDLAFASTHFVLFMSGVVRVRYAVETVAVVGLAVAATVHFFFFLHGFRQCILGHFTVQLSIKRRNPESCNSAVMKAKEAPVKPQSEQQQYEQLSPKPYRGSPSTKPSQTIGTIELTDPAETDTLMDHQE